MYKNIYNKIKILYLHYTFISHYQTCEYVPLRFLAQSFDRNNRNRIIINVENITQNENYNYLSQ